MDSLLEEDVNGVRVYPCTKPWSDGTTGLTLSPLALLEKLAALVPLSRLHLVHYAEGWASHSAAWGTLQELWTRRGRRRGARGDSGVGACSRGGREKYF